MSAIDQDVVRARLTLLQHHLARVDARCPGTLEELVANEDTQDIRAVRAFGRATASLVSKPPPAGVRWRNFSSGRRLRQIFRSYPRFLAGAERSTE